MDMVDLQIYLEGFDAGERHSRGTPETGIES
jgi:hypothetical protein